MIGKASHAAAALALAATPSPAQSLRDVAYPHPIISEVLFDVPKDADPNQDGVSNPVGDEYVEITNPHERPIDIGGYMIADKKGAASIDGGGGVRFRFPPLTLKPGETALLFNGYLAHIPGPVGSQSKAPLRPNDRFANAWVFNLDNASGTCAFANSGDICVLVSPDAKTIDFLSWGAFEPPPPKDAMRAQYFKNVRDCSVQRPLGESKLVLHREIDGKPFSPGRVPALKGAETPPAGAPAAGAGAPTEPKEDPLIPRPRKKDPPPAPKQNPAEPAPTKPR